MMSNLFKIFVLVFYLLLTMQYSFSENIVLETGISIIDKLPNEFYGSWKVEATRDANDLNSSLYTLNDTQLWILKRKGELLVLANPLSGAISSMSINDIKNKNVKFSKITIYPDMKMIEELSLTINDNTFLGIDKITLKYYENGKIVKQDNIEYKLKGKKITLDVLDFSFF